MSPAAARKPAVLITGAARRLGRGMAVALAREGWSVALHYHQSRAAARATQAVITQTGAACELLAADLGDEGQTRGLIAQARAVFPGLNLLINNASVYEPGGLHSDHLAVLRRAIDVNLIAPYILTAEFARCCGRGQVINILDANLRRARPDYLAYQLSKRALVELTALSAAALGPRIRVNGVAPGAVLPAAGTAATDLAALVRRTPLRRRVAVGDVVRAVWSLISQPSLTGQIVWVDGGQHLL